MLGGGGWNDQGFKASINCDRADDFDCSTQLLASNLNKKPVCTGVRALMVGERRSGSVFKREN